MKKVADMRKNTEMYRLAQSDLEFKQDVDDVMREKMAIEDVIEEAEKQVAVSYKTQSCLFQTIVGNRSITIEQLLLHACKFFNIHRRNYLGVDCMDRIWSSDALLVNEIKFVCHTFFHALFISS